MCAVERRPAVAYSWLFAYSFSRIAAGPGRDRPTSLIQAPRSKLEAVRQDPANRELDDSKLFASDIAKWVPPVVYPFGEGPRPISSKEVR
jgi:hypothetical protein